MSTAPVLPQPVHIMAKPTGAVCNLDCEYCFFLSKEQLYPGSGFRMSPQTHQSYLQQLFATHPANAEVTVNYQGGEPTLMGLDFFARSVELSARLARPGQRVQHTMQTNGTLLDDDLVGVLAMVGRQSAQPVGREELLLVKQLAEQLLGPIDTGRAHR